MNLLNEIKIVSLLDYQDAATGEINTNEVNLESHSGCMFIILINSTHNGASVEVTPQKYDESNNPTDIHKAILDTELIPGETDKILLDIYKPINNKLRLKINRKNQDSVINSVFGVLYQGRKKPELQEIKTISALFISPE